MTISKLPLVEDVEKGSNKGTELRALPSNATEPQEAIGGIDLEWRNLKAVVAKAEEQGKVARWLGLPEKFGQPDQVILDGASGFAKAGEILAVMGPSGSGKTTLLNILAQRPTLGKKGYWEGDLLLNGSAPWKDWERDMAYVMQRDIFYEELKVYENLVTTALLRLPVDWTRDRKLAYLDQTLDDLGLKDVKNTQVGGATVRGLSGGELKRTGIANERLARPRIFLLDEPLTGLDSSRAVEVMQSLEKMAREEGVTVMLTVHQPSSSVYACFGSLLMLGKGGRTAYFGPVTESVAHFTKLGYPLPTHWAPSDHFIELLAIEESRDAVCEEWPKSPQPTPPPPRPRVASLAPMPSFTDQVRVLCPRCFKRIVRSYLTPMSWKLHFAQAIVFGLVYFGVGKDAYKKEKDLIGTVFFIVSHWSFTPLFQGLMNFPKEKEMLTKERASKTYEIRSFFMSMVVTEAPVLLVFPVMFWMMVWPMAALPLQTMIQTFLVMSCNIQLCSALSMLISAVAMEGERAVSISIIVMSFQMCAGGFFADMRLLPWPLSWLRFTSFYYYTFGAVARLVITEPYGEEIPEKYSFSDLGYAWEISMLILMTVVMRILCYLQLKFTNKLKFS